MAPRGIPARRVKASVFPDSMYPACTARPVSYVRYADTPHGALSGAPKQTMLTATPCTLQLRRHEDGAHRGCEGESLHVDLLSAVRRCAARPGPRFRALDFVVVRALHPARRCGCNGVQTAVEASTRAVASRCPRSDSHSTHDDAPEA